MSESNESLEEFLFEAALSKSSDEERAAFLDNMCRGNPDLRSRLDHLLEGHFQAGGFLASEPQKARAIPLSPPKEEQPVSAFIGRYKLLEKIGEGGFGEVWMAEQREPVKRRVALKIIKLGMDTKQVVARFEAERQALALMDHPNIAKVLDGGATDTGRPYFVMELVRGIRITEYCDQHQLSTSERLKLFSQVCRAIQHAHQKGIIHRDIKPTNILVTGQDGVPVPKVIDFGIAKATQQELTQRTVFTQFHQFLGTPAYVSPEQAEMGSLDVDTRSDIYSLGVLLYELLTGKTPFESQELLAAGLDEMRRRIKEMEPARPSTRLSSMTRDELTTTAQRRGAEPPKLINQIRGDLDWIAMKCLEKDRSRRYETANGLARDVERHLNNEPILARPPSRIYEFQKMLQRHWVGFAAVATVVLILTVAALLSNWQAVRARRAQRNENQLRQEAQRLAAAEASARTLAEQRLYDARLGQSRAIRKSGMVGQRFESLAAVSDAANIRKSAELRDEAVAALESTDLQVEKTFNLPFRKSAEGMTPDDGFEYFACQTLSGISIRRFTDEREILSIPVKETDDLSLDINWFRFGPTSRYLRARVAHSGQQGVWRLWDLSRNGELALERKTDFLALSPDGRTVATARDDGTLVFEELGSSIEQRRIHVGSRLDQLLFSPDGKWIAGISDERPTLRVWDVGSGQIIMNCPNSEGICSLAWNENGTLLAVGGMEGGINLWDVESGEPFLRLDGHRGRIVGLGFDHGGGVLASTSWDATTRFWDSFTGQPLITYPTGASSLRFSPDDQTLAFAQDGLQSHLLRVIRPLGYRRLIPNTRKSSWFDLAFSPDRTLAAVAGDIGIRLFDLQSGRDLGVVAPVHDYSVQFGNDRAPSLWASAAVGIYHWPLTIHVERDHTVLRVGPSSLQTAHLWQRHAAFDRNESKVAITRFPESANIDGIMLCDLAHPDTPPRFCPHPYGGFVAMNPSANLVATGTWKGVGVRVWDFASGQLVRELPMHGSAKVLFSTDGEWLATASTSEYRLWDTKSWSPAPQLLPADPIWLVGEMAFSPDGCLLATCHDNQRIQIVMVPSLQVVEIIPCTCRPRSLKFLPDGARLAALDDRGAVHIWDLWTISSELKKLKLDWDISLPVPAPDSPSIAQPAFVLDGGPFGRQELSNAIPLRDTNAPGNLIDLTAYYNAPLTPCWFRPEEHGNDLAELPRGLQTFAGVTFDVRGLIQVGSGDTNVSVYLRQVLNIPIGQHCRRLHFLHAAVGAADLKAGEKMGHYQVHFVDGRQVEVPILAEINSSDWWSQTTADKTNLTIAWTGSNPVARKSGRTIRLFKYTWENPYPAVQIRQFDLISDPGASGAPFLVALTAEP